MISISTLADAHNDPGDDAFDAADYDPIADELDGLAVPDVVPHAQALVQGAPDDNGNDDEMYNAFDDAVDPGAAPGAEIAGAEIADAGAEIADDVSYGEDEGARPHDSYDDDHGDGDEGNDGDLAGIPDVNINEDATPGNTARYNLRPRVPAAAHHI